LPRCSGKPKVQSFDVFSAFSHSLGRKQPVVADRFRPILLKKSALVSTAEKYASEIEIFTFG
jgi:hypothetical protein